MRCLKMEVYGRGVWRIGWAFPVLLWRYSTDTRWWFVVFFLSFFFRCGRRRRQAFTYRRRGPTEKEFEDTGVLGMFFSICLWRAGGCDWRADGRTHGRIGWMGGWVD
ncbi:hypothetical protein BZA05DRAFT_239559 [Tricharina praecox]|uniref:uncharacterized protein n=1 Tax=Tricharina praecox TaxID=43433 RepID=UPI00221FDC9D|nr:uncharacterized protein BZA05DRAFT_239559 [Tricharina praecox]KAI5855422.1 hypothetical protein BZA05DRAFT_239559 [Tricharina praecox]